MPVDEKKKSKFALSDLELDEISLVDQGANQDAKVVLFKRAGGPVVPVQKPKGDSMTDLIKKCIDAVRDCEPARVSKKEYEDALDQMAQAVLEKSTDLSLSYEKAYDHVLHTPAGRALYTGYIARR